LLALLVCHLKHTDGVVAQLDWHKKHVANHLVQTTIDFKILT
jgi:hypothetical protein